MVIFHSYVNVYQRVSPFVTIYKPYIHSEYTMGTPILGPPHKRAACRPGSRYEAMEAAKAMANGAGPGATPEQAVWGIHRNPPKKMQKNAFTVSDLFLFF